LHAIAKFSREGKRKMCQEENIEKQPGHPGRKVTAGGILGKLRKQFGATLVFPVVEPESPPAPSRVLHEEMVAEPLVPVVPGNWDEARAEAVLNSVSVRVEQARHEIPASHPRREVMLAILHNELSILRQNIQRHDAIVWDWLDGLEHLLERWRT
jgi:hypothetical protein